MSINFTTKLIFISIFLSGLILTSCYEEPIIEPVKRPYSTIRVGNFSYNRSGFAYNVDAFSVYIDNELKGTVNVNTFTNYFDLPSGSRKFVLVTNGTDTIYNDNITITSYEELSVVFGGVYAPTVDTLMSFAPYVITDGIVYISEAPATGKANVITTNLAPNNDLQNQIKYSLAFVSAGYDTTIGGNVFEYNKTVGVPLPAGDYSIWVLNDVTAVPNPIAPEYDTIAVFQNVIIDNGMKENLFLIGNPETPELIKDQQLPLPVRPK